MMIACKQEVFGGWGVKLGVVCIEMNREEGDEDCLFLHALYPYLAVLKAFSPPSPVKHKHLESLHLRLATSVLD